MRFIDLEELKPKIRHLLPALEAAHAAVLAEADPVQRAALIAANRGHWVALRAEFSAYSHGKCWYVECKNPGTDDDIDHFRPKSGVKEDGTHPGYFWFAFDWKNLRLSCHRANRPRINPDGAGTGGKAGHFPLVNPAARAFTPAEGKGHEVPALLDPTDPQDVAMLTFQQNGEVALSPQFKGQTAAEAKLSASRLILHLDWPAFREARVVLYNQIERTVDRLVREAPNGDPNVPPTQAFYDAIRDLKNAMKSDQEYFAAARVYVESFKHIWWVREVVMKVAA
ncbi:hypothetical protein [Azoarcus taiwanensis]|uniref:TIGR02646 family protein n=1 Tax=Azoarcus taiwanensis TaxID=666964 RepID=A0A972FJ75_9RHOO|nr:hypothetical protein [Azoarcus taiwanensis]NMG03301.1 hypothetical protein [Azoarcus taiwanensis]